MPLTAATLLERTDLIARAEADRRPPRSLSVKRSSGDGRISGPPPLDHVHNVCKRSNIRSSRRFSCSDREPRLHLFTLERPALGVDVVDAGLGAIRAKLTAPAPASAPPPEPAQTLKQVTILFLDVVGSTGLAEHPDPEDVSAVMDGTLAAGTAFAEQHGGRVLQYAGDNLLAVFGAVRCGLALLGEGKRQGALVLSRHGRVGFDVRVGIHTDGVLLGGEVDAGGAIRGQAVNIAARMEQTAPPGALRISHDTYAQVRGVFEVEVQAPILVKGVDEPVHTYLVQAAKARAFRVTTRGIDGVETRMIGRHAVFERSQDAFKRLIAERRLAAVSVVGAVAALEIAVETQAKEDQMLALFALGAAELALGRTEAAWASFAHALELGRRCRPGSAGCPGRPGAGDAGPERAGPGLEPPGADVGRTGKRRHA